MVSTLDYGSLGPGLELGPGFELGPGLNPA